MVKNNIFRVASLLKRDLPMSGAKAKMAPHLLMRDIAILKSQMKAKCRNTEQLKAGLSVTSCTARNHVNI